MGARRFGNLSEADVGHRGIHAEGGADGILLNAVERREIVQWLATTVAGAIERAARRKTVGQRADGPFYADEDAVNIGVSRRAIRRCTSHFLPQTGYSPTARLRLSAFILQN